MFEILRNVTLGCVCILSGFLSAYASNNQVDIELFAPSDGDIAGTISHKGSVRLTLVRGQASGSAILTLKEFEDPNGNKVAVSFKTGDKLEHTKTITLDEERKLFTLFVKEARPGISYSGELWIKIGESPTQSVTLTLKGAELLHYSVIPQGTQSMPVNVPASSIVRLHLDVRDLKERVSTVRIVVSTFSSIDDGHSVEVYLLAAGKDLDYKSDKNNASEQVPSIEITDIGLVEDFLPVILDASNIPIDKRFVGEITLEGGDEKLVTYIELNRHALERNADPTLSRTSVSAEMVCFLPWGGCTQPAVSVLLREADGDEPLVGVYASGAPPPSEPGDAKVLSLDLIDVRFDDAGNDAPSLLGIDPKNPLTVEQQTIPQGGQRLVRIQFNEKLNAGLYKMNLRFGALNADSAKLDDLMITLRVERHWIWAVLMLLFGVILSFLATKGVASMRQRAELSRKINKHRMNYWLRLDHSGTKPIVRALARIAKMREALTREKGLKKLSVPRVIGEEIRVVEEHLPYLERLSACMAYWEGKETYVARRALKALRALADKLQSVPLETKPDQTIEEAFNEIKKWQNDTQMEQVYIQNLKKEIDNLLFDIGERALGENEKNLINDAFNEIKRLVPELKKITDTKEYLSIAIDNDPNLPYLNEIKTSLETLLKEYISLKDDIETEANATIAEHRPLSATVTVLDKRFMAAYKKEREPLSMISERLSLLNKSSDDNLKKATDRIKSFQSMGIDRNKLQSALDRIKQVEADLSSNFDYVVTRLKALVEKKKSVSEHKEALELDKLYMTLKVIWESKDFKDCTIKEKLLAAHQNRSDPETLFEIMDNFVWGQLPDPIDLTEPSTGLWNDESGNCDSPEPGHEEYQPITFKAATSNGCEKTYLFKHGLSFHWEISVPDTPFRLNPVTKEPTVSQFIPFAKNNVIVKAEVSYKRMPNSPKHIQRRCFRTVKSGEFRILNAFSKAEVLGTVLALTFAIVTGLQSEYLKADLLGSFEDYLALFAWGFISDQAKSIIQNIGATGSVKAGTD